MRKSIGIIMIVVIMTALISGCKTGEENDMPEENVGLPEKIFELQDYPKCDGSVLTLPVSEAVCAALTGEEIQNVHSTVIHNGSDKAVENLLNSNAEIIFTEMAETELKEAAEKKNISIETVPVARDYYVFYTDAENADDVNDGEQPGITAEEAESVLIGTSSTDTKYEYGYFLSGYAPAGIQILAVDGVYPSAETVESGEYPFTFSYNAVIRADSAADSGARKIIAALLDEKGQHLLEEAGYVKL